MQTAQQTITVVDTTDPVFDTFPSDAVLECPNPDTSLAVTGTPTYHDGCGGAVTMTHSDSADVAGTCSGTYTFTRTFTLTDLYVMGHWVSDYFGAPGMG